MTRNVQKTPWITLNILSLSNCGLDFDYKGRFFRGRLFQSIQIICKMKVQLFVFVTLLAFCKLHFPNCINKNLSVSEFTDFNETLHIFLKIGKICKNIFFTYFHPYLLSNNNNVLYVFLKVMLWDVQLVEMMVYANQTPKSKFKNASQEPKIVLFLWAAMVTEVLWMSKVAQTTLEMNLDCEVVFTFQAMSNMRSMTNIAFVTLMSVTVIDAKWNFAVVLFQILKCAEILLNVINQVKSVFLEIDDFCHYRKLHQMSKLYWSRMWRWC